MAYYTYTKDPKGVFVERDTGNYFEYSDNDDPISMCEDFPHKVWVGGEGVCGMKGYRYAIVKKTVAYICVDEDEFGLPVLEKWYIKGHKKYGFGRAAFPF